MNTTTIARLVWIVTLAAPSLGWAQATPQPPREFAEFRGTWIRDGTAGEGNIAGLPVAATMVIATTPTEISVAKDSAAPEIYPLDGTDRQLIDPRTGAALDRHFRFTLVAETLALTSTQTRPAGGGPIFDPRRLTTIITDVYRVDGDLLTVERQHSVLAQPPGHLVTLQNPRNNRQTIVYRRSVQ